MERDIHNFRLIFDKIDLKYGAPNLPPELPESEAQIAIDALENNVNRLRETVNSYQANSPLNSARGIEVVLRGELNHVTSTLFQLHTIAEAHNLVGEIQEFLEGKD